MGFPVTRSSTLILYLAKTVFLNPRIVPKPRSLHAFRKLKPKAAALEREC